MHRDNNQYGSTEVKYLRRESETRTYFQSAVNTLNSYFPAAFQLETKTIFFPSGENSGNEVNSPKSVTCSRPLPSVFMRNNSNLRVSQACLFDAKRIFLSSGVNVGAKLAQPKFVSCF